MDGTDPRADGRMYFIRTARLERLQDAIAKSNRRATKLGCAPCILTVYGTAMVPNPAKRCPVTSNLLPTTFTEYSWCWLEGASPRIGDARFVAAIDSVTGDDGCAANVLRVFEDEDGKHDLAGYRDAPIKCDHCGTVRRRLRSYLVWDPRVNAGAGGITQVGSTCLADFIGAIGVRNPQDLAQQLEWRLSLRRLCEEAQDGSFGGGHDTRMDRDAYLALVAAIIREHGWMSRTAARASGGERPATATIAAQQYRSTKHERWHVEVTDEDRKLATDALAWLEDYYDEVSDTGTPDDYTHNLWASTRSSVVATRHEGIVASLFAAYQRAKNEEIKRQERAKNAAAWLNEWIGEVGSRVALAVKVCEVREISTPNSQWSDSKTLVRFADADRRQLVWFSTGNQASKLEPGAEVRIKATVRKHDSYNGARQTIVSRVNVLA